MDEWWDKSHMNSWDKLFRKWKKSRTPANKQNYRQMRNFVNIMVRSAKEEHTKQLLPDSSNDIATNFENTSKIYSPPQTKTSYFNCLCHWHWQESKNRKLFLLVFCNCHQTHEIQCFQTQGLFWRILTKPIFSSRHGSLWMESCFSYTNSQIWS